MRPTLLDAIDLKPGEAYAVDWVRDEDVHACALCATAFGFFVRRHHCRGCGHIVCAECAVARREVYGLLGLERVCDACLSNGVWVDPVARRALEKLEQDEDGSQDDEAYSSDESADSASSCADEKWREAVDEDGVFLPLSQWECEVTRVGGARTVCSEIAPIEDISSLEPALPLRIKSIEASMQPDAEPRIGDAIVVDSARQPNSEPDRRHNVPKQQAAAANDTGPTCPPATRVAASLWYTGNFALHHHSVLRGR
ncbi:hypothetical protein, variant [Saprolegnia diclina VS20]|uniref:FYVE-type domain-containing protein n=1 Tax=Saprolegnia diclina (strain VS20) TaxID=1156394 RepID=T0RUR9_SAPDV|nr:hypothetical protein, variant [Saprolegnia diclina VS20]EQC36218.1 hypothetical protein, variant [Saprolegnia diclina VS20]|eukprot:XP_008610324.1 hypothetical protein, variant [Saprolegnia diclina VS20]